MPPGTSEKIEESVVKSALHDLALLLARQAAREYYDAANAAPLSKGSPPNSIACMEHPAT
jgi:hypothetical protein